ncbi:hypothetical protein SDRG_14949 [Saprolegnia diclina VS20]|uniref:START domain-containing protein n=1 Tax=Saprolegnia diclina (strain VS20) TaxID=1156394 RepID=T0RC97_SAPDV|nr:hypothetical protein SDRG_14949 [Saprolegnia diclina VS20]EQC27232.1 hypothetical protein SDRG_14949 [Saprolegnia diclina VS20]|eukprot:XP_008619331.1 hypothetical protein SDRG_14949 [Saprolegnia diclina VS20]
MMSTSEASPADVITMTDLHFLLATDSHLQDELAEVCHLLDAYASDGLAESVYSTSSDNETTKKTIDSILEDFHTTLDEEAVAPAKAPKAPRRKRKKIIDEEPLPAVGARNKFQYRQKQEILRLRKEVAELQETLETSKASTALTQNVDWEAAARRHFAESRRAMAEHHQLRAAVAHQTTLIDSMKAYIHKKPRIDVTSSEETWAQYKLAAQHSLRVAAIHAIADRQYARQRPAFDKAGLLANDNEVHIARALRPHAESCVLLEFINQLRHPAPFHVIGDAIWSVMNGENGQEVAADATQTIDLIDDDTVYQRYTQAMSPSTTIHANTIAKQYREDHRRVIVWRNVLEDERVPHMSRGAREQQWGWAIAEDEGPRQCKLTIYLQVPLDRSHCDDVALAQASLQQMQFSTPTDNAQDAASRPVHPTAAVMSALMGKGRLFELALRKAIRKAIESHYYAMSQPRVGGV